MRLQDQRTARAGRERNNLRGIPDSRHDPDLRAIQRASTRGNVSINAPGEAFGVGVSQGTNPWEKIAQESRRALGYLAQWTKHNQQTSDATTLAQVSTDVTEWKINQILGLRNQQGFARVGSTLRAHKAYLDKFLSDEHLEQFPERLRPGIAARYKSEVDDFLTKMAREEYDYNEKFRNESMSAATESLIQEAIINLPDDNLELPGDSEVENYGDLEESIATQIALNTRGTDFGEPVVQEAIRDQLVQAKRKIAIGQVKGLMSQGRYDAADGWLEKHRDIAGAEYAAMKNTIRVARDGEAVADVALNSRDRREMMASEQYLNLPATAQVEAQDTQIRLAGLDNAEIDINNEAKNDAADAVASVLYEDAGMNTVVISDMAEQQGWDADFHDRVVKSVTNLHITRETAHLQSANEYFETAQVNFQTAFPNASRHRELTHMIRVANGAPPEYREELLIKTHTMHTEKTTIEFNDAVSDISEILKHRPLLNQQEELAKLPTAYRKPVEDLLKAHNEGLAKARKTTDEMAQEDMKAVSTMIAGNWVGDGTLHRLQPRDRAYAKLLNYMSNRPPVDRLASNDQVEEFDKLTLGELRQMGPREVWNMTRDVYGVARRELNSLYRYALEGGDSREREFTDVEKSIIRSALVTEYEKAGLDWADDDVRGDFRRTIDEIHARLPDGPGEVSLEIAAEVANRVFHQSVRGTRDAFFSWVGTNYAPQSIPDNVDITKLQLRRGASRDVVFKVGEDIRTSGKGFTPRPEDYQRLLVYQTIIDSDAAPAIKTEAKAQRKGILDNIYDLRQRAVERADEWPGFGGP